MRRALLLCSLLSFACMPPQSVPPAPLGTLPGEARVLDFGWNPFRYRAEVLPDTGALVQAAQVAAQVDGLRPAEREAGPRLEAADGPWRRLPWARIEDGRLVVRWETREPTPAGSLQVGVRVLEDPLAPARYVAATREDLVGRETVHVAAAPLEALFAPGLDVNGTRARGFGEVCWRVETYDAALGGGRSWQGRVAFRFDADGGFVQQPAVVLGPRVDRLDGDTVVVIFETDVPTTAAVGVTGLPPVLSPGAPEAGVTTPSTRHEVFLSGLEPGRVHVYQVAASDGAETSVTAFNAFRTHRADAPVTVAVLGGAGGRIGPGETVLPELAVRSVQEGAEAIFVTGDLGEAAVQRQPWWRAVEPVAQSVPFYEATGGDGRVGSWDLGPVHFAWLPAGGALTDEQAAKLEADLAGARERRARHLVVLGDARDRPDPFWALLARYDVLAYVSGRDPGYTRALVGPESVAGAEGSVWALNSGGVAAGYAVPEAPEPLDDGVLASSARQHLLLWTFEGDAARLRVIDRWGDTVDDVDLVSARARSATW